MFNFIRNNQLLSKMVVAFYMTNIKVRVSISVVHILISKIFNFSYYNSHTEVTNYGFNLYFLDDEWSWLFFMCFLAICTSFLKCLIKSFVHVYIGLRDHFTHCWYKIICQIYILQILFFSLCLLVDFRNGALQMTV